MVLQNTGNELACTYPHHFVIIFFLWIELSLSSNDAAQHQLCVFVPTSPRSSKDAMLALVALQTWAAPDRRKRHNAAVRFLSPPGAVIHPGLAQDTDSFQGDVDTDYKRLPIRTFRMWSYLGEHWSHKCEWFMKADADSYVNLKAVTSRLACFNSQEQYYFGVTHAILPAANARDRGFTPLYFGHGGSGYIISQGLMVDAGLWSAPCLDMTMRATFGDAMEDVAFAMCMRTRGIEVLNYGLHASEYILNFHQARQSLLNCTDDVMHEIHWDAKPPPVGACILVIHPVEMPDDMRRVHACIQNRELQHHTCLIEPLQLAQQSQVKIVARGADPKGIWDPSQFEPLHNCFMEVAPLRICKWKSIDYRCYGLSPFSPAISRASCAEACCVSNSCVVYQFHNDAGCWLGDACWAAEDAEADSIDGWNGATKVAVREVERVDDNTSDDKRSWEQERMEQMGFQRFQNRVENWEARCWTAIPGKYLPQFTSLETSCFSEEHAKKKCVETPECDGLTLQWDMCGGHLWTLRIGRIARTEPGFDASNLKSLLLSRSCVEAHMFSLA